jgi:hypothetical protein
MKSIPHPAIAVYPTVLITNHKRLNGSASIGISLPSPSTGSGGAGHIYLEIQGQPMK